MGKRKEWSPEGRNCMKCERFLPWDNFQLDPGGAQGRASRCRDCRTQMRYDWASRNPERHRATQAAFRDSGAKAQAERRYAERNAEKIQHKNSQLHAMARGAEGRHSLRDWRSLVARFGGRCAYCAERPVEQRDHVVPISRGGSNYIGNILPACKPCNQSKGTMTLSEWRLTGRAPVALKIAQGAAA